MARKNISAVSPYADAMGFSRAVRSNGHVFVAGCAAIGPDGENVGIGDAATQARRCFEIIGAALKEALLMDRIIVDIVEIQVEQQVFFYFFVG